MSEAAYRQYRPLIAAAAAKYGIQELIIAAVIEIESGWRNVQNAGGYDAWGLMQVVSSRTIAGRPTPEQLLDPATNIDWGTRILAEAWARGGGLKQALWRYSGGSYWDRQGGAAAYTASYWRRFMDAVATVGCYVPLGDSLPRPPEDTGAGIHGGANAGHPMGENEAEFAPTARRWRAMGLTWCKLLAFTDQCLKVIPALREAGIMPVIRFILKCPERLSAEQLAAVSKYVAAGAGIFEWVNEPNLRDEWSVGQMPADDIMFSQLAVSLAADMRAVSERGGYVAVPAMSPGGEWHSGRFGGDDVGYLRRLLEELRKQPGIAETLRARGWLSVHPTALNHPLDYPYDAVNQAEWKGQHLYEHYTADGQATGASNCWLKWKAVAEQFLDVFGFLVPVIGTEGGAWPHGGTGQRYDPRYAELDVQAASECTGGILRSMAGQPAWFAAMCPWLWANKMWGNPHTGFEWQAWHRTVGWGNPPAAGPEWQPMVGMLEADPCQRRGSVAMPTPTMPQTPAAPAESQPAAADITAIRWHAEEAVRELEAALIVVVDAKGRLEAARGRLLEQVVAPAYELEGVKTASS
jgi:hypothetical protein